MALVTVTHAARLAGISRQYLYKAYIKTGKVSVERDSKGSPLIETSELLRVFGVLGGEWMNTPVDDESLHVETLEKRLTSRSCQPSFQQKMRLFAVWSGKSQRVGSVKRGYVSN